MRVKPGSFLTEKTRFKTVHIDLVGPLPEAEGFKYILTAIERSTSSRSQGEDDQLESPAQLPQGLLSTVYSPPEEDFPPLGSVTPTPSPR